MQLFSGLRAVENWIKSSALIILIGALVWLAAGRKGSDGGLRIAPAPFIFPQPQVL